MGQYYRPCFLSEDKKKVESFAYSHDFGSGLKLMEHSWMKNGFVGFIERQLLVSPKRLVWAGDYADDEIDGENLYSISESSPRLMMADHPKDKYSEEAQKAFGKLPLPKRYKYLINYDKREYVDKSKVPSDDGWTIHPLPLLTCEGNGRGGGDFRGDSFGLVGRWSRDTIGITSRKSDILQRFTEVVFNLTE
jgi:hypothetical protein